MTIVKTLEIVDGIETAVVRIKGELKLAQLDYFTGEVLGLWPLD